MFKDLFPPIDLPTFIEQRFDNMQWHETFLDNVADHLTYMASYVGTRTYRSIFYAEDFGSIIWEMFGNAEERFLGARFLVRRCL